MGQRRKVSQEPALSRPKAVSSAGRGTEGDIGAVQALIAITCVGEVDNFLIGQLAAHALQLVGHTAGSWVSTSVRPGRRARAG